MQILLMYVAEAVAFDEERVRRALVGLRGTSELRREELTDSPIEANYVAGGDSTVVRLSQDRQTLSIHGTGVAARRFVVAFQARYGGPLHLIDDSYTFDEVVDGSQSDGDVAGWLTASA